MVPRISIPVGAKLTPITRNESPTISTTSTDTEASLSLSTQVGILKACQSRSDTIRVDRAGTLIVAGSKSHRVCFADEVHDSPRPIAKVHHIESFKRWNLGNRFEGQPGCVCTIS